MTAADSDPEPMPTAGPTRPAPSGRGLRDTARPGGFTLLELLLVLALLAAVAAIALPGYERRWRESRFTEMTEQTRTIFVLARADAQLHRELLRVVWLPADRRLELRRLDLAAPDASRGSSPFDRPGRVGDPDADARPPGRGGLDPALLDGSVDEGEGRWRPDSFSRLALPERYEVVLPGPDGEFPPEPEDQESSALALDPAVRPGPTAVAATEAGTLEGFGPNAMDDAPVTLAVFAGDGSALLARSFLLRDGRGRRTRFEIDPWTAAVTIERLDRGRSDAEEDADPALDRPEPPEGPDRTFEPRSRPESATEGAPAPARAPGTPGREP